MKIQVLADRTIGSLQEEFHEKYPYLKLVFFSKPHKAFEGSPAKYILSTPEKTLGSIEANPHDGKISIDGEMPTWRLEQLFEKEFGLHVQVFRKSGTLWLETSKTDQLTLQEQNSKGRESDHIVQLDDVPEFREQP
jgi:hypothetical protein